MKLDILIKVANGYKLFLKSIFLRVDYRRLDLPVKISSSLLILTTIGIVRAFLSVGMYSVSDLDFALVFCAAIFPVFLCFFPAMTIDYVARRWKWPMGSSNILGFFFFSQILHITIPIIDRIISGHHFYLTNYFPNLPYFKLALSPLASTPLFFFVKSVVSFGAVIVWFIAAIATIKYGFYHKVNKVKLLLVLMLIFYVVYVTSYPPFLINFKYVRNHIPEGDFYTCLPFITGAIGSVLYFDKGMNKLFKKRED